MFCIAFPREYTHHWIYSETLFLNHIAEVMLSWWCDSAPPKKLYLSWFLRRHFFHRHSCDGGFYRVCSQHCDAIYVWRHLIYLRFFFVWTVPRSAVKLHEVFLGTIMRSGMGTDSFYIRLNMLLTSFSDRLGRAWLAYIQEV